MYVCVCKAVTERQIHEAIRLGARTLKDLRRELDITRECGQCASCARQCIKAALGEQRQAGDGEVVLHALANERGAFAKQARL